MVMRIQQVQSKKTHTVAKRRICRNSGMIAILLICATIGYLDRIADDIPPSSGQMICVYNTGTSQLMQMDLETYIVGVVAAEMPASFELEALKAQAVAARTFALHRIAHPNKKVTALHPNAQITTSPDTCQAWIDDSTQKERWGSSYALWRNKIVQAVAETAGEVLYYEDALIEPVYHASCGGGSTEAAEHVWGTAKPYLISVVCNHPPDKHSGETVTISMQELAQKLNLEHSVAVGAMQGATEYITEIERTASNRIKTLQIGGKTIRGGLLRSALGLKSAVINWEIIDDSVVFTTNGYGHGAGMCQHGADYYAAQGYDYRQILQHYYPGVSLAIL